MEGRDRWISEFKASLDYRVSSRSARAVTQRNPVSKTNKQKVKKDLCVDVCVPVCVYVYFCTVPPEARGGMEVPGDGLRDSYEDVGAGNRIQVLGRNSAR